MAKAVRIQLDLSELDAMIERGRAHYPKAAAAAINRALRSMVRPVSRSVAAEQNIRPQRLVAVRVKVFRARASDPNSGSVGVLLRGIAAARLAGVRANRKRGGIVAGVYHWPAGFVAKGRGRHPQVFVRRGRERLPIDAQKIEITAAVERVLGPEAERAAGVAVDRLAHELARRMGEGTS